MKAKKGELKVFYFGFSPKIDKVIDKLLKSEGYEFDSSGYDFAWKTRDLLYTKKLRSKLCPNQ